MTGPRGDFIRKRPPEANLWSLHGFSTSGLRILLINYMKQFIQVFLVCTLICATKISSAQSSLDKMNQPKRDSTLLARAKQAIITYGPGYYRDYKQTIERKQIYDGNRKLIDIYLITYYYDKSKEKLEYNFAAEVIIKARTGLVSSVIFGNGMGFAELDRKKIRKNKNILTTPYQAVRPINNRE